VSDFDAVIIHQRSYDTNDLPKSRKPHQGPILYIHYIELFHAFEVTINVDCTENVEKVLLLLYMYSLLIRMFQLIYN
jgi:hypothetical protein